MSGTPEDRARDRLAVLIGLRAGGAVLLAAGLYLWLGGAIDGADGFGTVLVAAGAIAAFVLPALLVRRWRSRR